MAIGLVVLRLGSHLVLGPLGPLSTAVASTLGHVLFAPAMSTVTVALPARVRRTARTALVAAGKATA
ncbi:hypothetical protein K353_06599 [Kitasatospora sp. SolWspMP-SS2h]|uniref:hypothetical protein n=1 Tax=Kitasatospora sp. SolWspMP-SS2h TaxID=1305729 RepID=UPI000DBA7C9F|nr:hypothetical protein [Kitasatospora sp. SolWspMP-SS2h]RAJ29671.1 hypothetical protein K353_06599 [Kitasatospora sp. SolWspMP-SS2h]